MQNDPMGARAERIVGGQAMSNFRSGYKHRYGYVGIIPAVEFILRPVGIRGQRIYSARGPIVSASSISSVQGAGPGLGFENPGDPLYSRRKDAESPPLAKHLYSFVGHRERQKGGSHHHFLKDTSTLRRSRIFIHGPHTIFFTRILSVSHEKSSIALSLNCTP
jgi:hypothetical protein